MKIALALTVSCAVLALVRTEDEVNLKQVKLPQDMVNEDGSLPDVPAEMTMVPDQMERRGGKGGKGGESAPPPLPGWGWGPPPMMHPPMMHGGWGQQSQPIVIPLTLPLSLPSYGQGHGGLGSYGMPYGR